MESKVIRLSGITLEAIEEFRQILIDKSDNEFIKTGLEEQSIDDLIRITFVNAINQI